MTEAALTSEDNRFGELPTEPDVSWPVQVSQQDVMKWIHRRLPEAEQVRAALYHHPMLGIAFRWSRPLAKPLLAHALVDLVGGRAYAAEHWDDVEFVPIDQVEVGSDMVSPKRKISDAQAAEAARRLVNGVLLRRRRLDFAGRLENLSSTYFGKPNWWVQGTYEGRKIEIIVDALNGNHYVFTA